jgi:iron complex outermembrane receptor protein
MKKNIILFILFSPLWLTAQIRSTTLTGTVTDAQTGLPLPGATIYLPDLKRGTTADKEGHYQMENLPAVKLLVVFKYVGYTSSSVTLDLSALSEYHAALAPSYIESREVVITGSAFTTDDKKSSIAIAAIDKEKLRNTPADNLISAISQTPGLSEITTGNNVSKPVIRGLSYNRIVVLNEGIRQEGQQWGDEHGIEIDQYAADRIEILKGPGSLLYGSDALGGVINILEPVPAQQGKINGEWNSAFSTNNGLIANSFLGEGNHNGVLWRAQGSYKNAASFQTPAERVYNSAFNEWSGNVMLGVNKRWGYSHLHASIWKSKIGFSEGERDSATGQFIDEEGNIISENDLNSRKIAPPYQDVEHRKVTLVNNFIIGKNQLKLDAGWQQNNRMEFEAHHDHGHDHGEEDGEPSLDLLLNTVSGNAKFFFAENKGWEKVIGISGIYKNNENFGEEFLIPDYTSSGSGVFGAVKKNLQKLTLNAGLRFDYHQIKVKELISEGETVFEPFSATYNAMSGSAGLAYGFMENWNVKLNIGRGFRVPDVSELSANGIHEGTFRYEIGNKDLKPETSLQFDFTLQAEGKIWDAELSLFHNQIDNFIYYRNLADETIDVDGSLFPVYRFIQGNSALKGFELHTDLHLLEHLHFDNDLSYVHAVNKDLDKPLPFIPAFRMNNALAFDFELNHPGILKTVSVHAEAETHLKQNRIDVFETPTHGYTLFHAGVRLQFRKDVELSVQCRNLANEKYFNHLSRLKEVNILNPGRNIIFMMRIPLTFK